MAKQRVKTALKPGDAFYIPVDEALHVRESDPCNKDNCMLSRGFIDYLVKTYGGKPSDFKVKSTNHGVTFVLKDRRYVAVFDTKTASRIYKYDQTFRSTRSKEKARAGVRSFVARVMVEASSAVTKWPAMSEATKSHLKSLPRKKKDLFHVPKTTGTRRELSM
jgi:hypothetical protein